MKPKTSLHHFLALAGSSLLAVSSASAADLFWSANGTIQGGAGTWDTSNARWGSVAAGPYTTTWDNTTNANDTAVFGSTGGSVTLGSNVTVRGLTFNSNSYVIDPGTGPFGINFSAPGSIDVSTGNATHTATINAVISGSAVSKTGTGILILGGINTFNGITLNGGNLRAANNSTSSGNDNFGAAGSTISVTGNSTISYGAGVSYTFDKAIDIASGVTLTMVKSAAGSHTYQGVVSGGNNTTLLLNDAGSVDQRSMVLSNASNTFTGKVDLTLNRATLRVASIGDATGTGNILLGRTSENGFYLDTSAVAALELNHRQIEIASGGAASGFVQIYNTNTTAANTLSINTDLLVNSTGGTKNIRLGGANTGANTFGGKIADANGTVISITKNDAGTWILSGDNAYTGGTSITAGTLQIAKTQAMPATGTFAVATGGTLAVNVGGTGEFSDATSGTGSLGGLLAGTGGKGGAVTYTGTVTLGIDTTNASGGNFTYAGDIATVGTTFNLRKIGTNTLTLSGNNSFNGSLTVAQGTVSINTINNASSAGVLGNSANAVVLGSSGNTGTLLYTGATASSTKTFTAATSGTGVFNIQEAATNLTLSGIIGGSGNITKAGAGILTLGVANGYTGATDVNGGELRWGVSNAIAAGALNINDGGTVNMDTFTDSVGAVTIAKGGTISGTTGTLSPAGNALVSNNGGTISLGASSSGAIVASNVTYNDTIEGSTTLNIERLTIGNLTLNVARGDDASGIDVNINILRNSANAGRTIVKNGSGVAQLSGSIQSESFGLGDGATTINDGTLIFNKSAEVTATGFGLITIGDDSGSANSAVLQFRTSNNQIGNNAITIKSDGLFDLNGRSETTSGALINNGSITTGAGTLTLSNNTATALTMGGTGSINGNITMSGNNNATGITATGDTSIAGVLALGTSNNRAIAVTNSDDKLTISAQLTGGTGRTLAKSGAGTLNLSADNTGFAAAISVTDGTLLVNNTTGSGTGSGAVSVGASGTLGGSGTIAGATTINGALMPGNSPGVLNFSTSLALAATSTTTLEIDGATRGSEYDGVNVGTTLSLGGGLVFDLGTVFLTDTTFNLFDAVGTSGDFSTVALNGSMGSGAFTFDTVNVWSYSNGGNNWTFTQSTGDLALTVIPEPGAALLGSIGMLVLLRRRR